MMHKIVKSL